MDEAMSRKERLQAMRSAAAAASAATATGLPSLAAGEGQVGGAGAFSPMLRGAGGNGGESRGVVVPPLRLPGPDLTPPGPAGGGPGSYSPAGGPRMGSHGQKRAGHSGQHGSGSSPFSFYTDPVAAFSGSSHARAAPGGTSPGFSPNPGWHGGPLGSPADRGHAGSSRVPGTPPPQLVSQHTPLPSPVSATAFQRESRGLSHAFHSPGAATPSIPPSPHNPFPMSPSSPAPSPHLPPSAVGGSAVVGPTWGHQQGYPQQQQQQQQQHQQQHQQHHTHQYQHGVGHRSPMAGPFSPHTFLPPHHSPMASPQGPYQHHHHLSPGLMPTPPWPPASPTHPSPHRLPSSPGTAAGMPSDSGQVGSPRVVGGAVGGHARSGYVSNPHGVLSQPSPSSSVSPLPPQPGRRKDRSWDAAAGSHVPSPRDTGGRGGSGRGGWHQQQFPKGGGRHQGGRSRRGGGSGGRGGHSPCARSQPEMFFKPSMLADPWAHLL